MKIFYAFPAAILIVFECIAQDVGVSAILNPVTKCSSLMGTDTVTIQITNFGAQTIFVPFNVTYRQAPATSITELLPSNAFPIAGGGTYTYSFTRTTNLSVPGTYVIDAFSSLPGDANRGNDSIIGYSVTSYPLSAGGTITGSAKVCTGTNGGVLNLSGYTGNIIRWESSVNGGTTWDTIINTTSAQTYSNLTATTMYRSTVQSGTCTQALSTTATITADTFSVGGSITGIASVCSGANQDTLRLSGHTGSIVKWQSSIDTNITWQDISNTITFLIFNNLTQTTAYRAILLSGVCPADTSLIATVNTISSIGGNTGGSGAGCVGSNTGTMTLTGHTGNVIRWESSINSGTSWDTILNTSTSHTFNNLLVNTLFRAVVQNSICATAASTTALISIDSLSLAGVTNGNDTVCSGAETDTVILSGYRGTTIFWEGSANGGTTWTATGDSGSMKIVNKITTSTLYRAIVKNGSCYNDTSSPATITAIPLPVASAGNGATINLGQSIVLDGSGGIAYAWTPGTSVNNPSAEDPVATPTATTSYTVVVTDINGCSQTASVTITVTVELVFTNIITPNGDGKNDVWYVQNIEQLPDCKVTIYNKYGQIVYSATKYSNNWGGTYGGSPLPDGTYYYIVNCSVSKEIHKGIITIVR